MSEPDAQPVGHAADAPAPELRVGNGKGGEPHVELLPQPKLELTTRAVCVAVVVAALMGAAEPVVVLKIGYGPNMSVVSAFLGFIALSLLGLVTGTRGTRWENNLVQTAGTAAGSGVGFMAVVLAAIDMLNQRGLLSLHLTHWQIFAWLAPSGMLGVLLAVPLRKHYIDEENLPFADGMAAEDDISIAVIQRR